MGIGIQVSALTTVPAVKEWIGIGALSNEHDALIQEMIQSVSEACHSHCKRESFLSATYEHDGTTRNRLAGTGDGSLWLPNTPVTSIASLKRHPDESDLTQGYDGDYDYDPWTGEVCLLNGSTFPSRPRSVEITYTGGYLPYTAPAAERAEFGWRERAADLEQSIRQMVAVIWRRRQTKEELSSFSTDRGTFAVQEGAIPAAILRVWDRYRNFRVS